MLSGVNSGQLLLPSALTGKSHRGFSPEAQTPRVWWSAAKEPGDPSGPNADVWEVPTQRLI